MRIEEWLATLDSKQRAIEENRLESLGYNIGSKANINDIKRIIE